jgi:hypothetical protein
MKIKAKSFVTPHESTNPVPYSHIYSLIPDLRDGNSAKIYIREKLSGIFCLVQ